jgi:hypothetical protein
MAHSEHNTIVTPAKLGADLKFRERASGQIEHPLSHRYI